MMFINYNYVNYRNSYKKIIKYVILLVIYFSTVEIPTTMYNEEIMSYFYLRRACDSILRLFTILPLLNAGLVILALKLLANFIITIVASLNNHLNKVEKNYVVKNLKFEMDGLDSSNPFLYAYKTRALLE